VVFVEVDGGREVREKDGLSISNPREAEAAVAVTHFLLGAVGAARAGGLAVSDATEIGIIAPYAAQVRRVRELWMETNRARRTSRPQQGPTRARDVATDELEGLEVHSVDGFQGREKEVIVLCTTRSNERGNVGFVRDDRRVNVAMTRARRGLIVLGNRQTLSTDPTWRAWFKWIDDRGLALRFPDLGLASAPEKKA
jgi:regulator of nonsense transcripts 1